MKLIKKGIDKEKVKERLKVVGKVLGTAFVVAGAVYAVVTSTDESTTDSYEYMPLGNDDDQKGENHMRCSYCGNTDKNTLWDEGDTIFCSCCHHRTSLETGQDDLVECPYCHRMRDRKAAYCRYCNDSAWEPSTAEEFAEIDQDLKDMGY